jgi:hypothetical protein
MSKTDNGRDKPGHIVAIIYVSIERSYAPFRNCSGSTGDEPLRISK